MVDVQQQQQPKQEELVADLLAQLVRQVLPAGTAQRTRDLAFRRATALVASAIGRSTSSADDDPTRSTDRVAADIRRGLLLRSSASSAAAPLAFSELVSRLTSSSQQLLRRPAAILALLHALSSASPAHPPLPRVAPDITTPSLLAGVVPPKLRPALVGSLQQKHSFPAIPDADHDDADDQQELVRDVVHALQGVATQRVHVVGGSSSASATVVPVSAQSPGPRALAARIAEAGWLYRRVAGAAGDPPAGCGVAATAFSAALRAELCEYDRLVAVLASQLGAGPERLTLHRLLVLVDEPMRRLELLAMIADAVLCSSGSSKLVGGALAGVVHGFAHHGDPLVREVVDRLVSRVARPLHEMAVKWMCDGTLSDALGELFIAVDAAAPEEAIWTRKYTLCESMLPPYISKALAQRILLVGKTVAFIRGECGDSQWQLDETIVSALSEHGIEYNRDAALAVATAKAADAAGHRLLELVRDKFTLLRHATAIKRFLLLCQGDFAQALVEQLAHELSQPSVTLMRHSLMPALESALRASCAAWDPRDVVDRLDIRLPESSPEKTGWETFSLAYIIDGPATAVFTPAAMDAYLTLFRTLWALKRAEHELGCTWQLQSWTNRALCTKQIKAILPTNDLLLCNALRSEAEHFVANVRHFVMDDVLEPAWNVFSAVVATTATCLDDVIIAHIRFLETVSERALVTAPVVVDPQKRQTMQQAQQQQPSKLRQLCQRLLAITLAFCSQQEAFLTSTLQEIDRLRGLRDDLDAEAMTDGIEEHEEDEKEETEYAVQLPGVRQRLAIISQELRSVQSAFLKELAIRAPEDPGVRTLLLRLDFNSRFAQL